MKNRVTPGTNYARRLKTLAQFYHIAEVRIINAYFAAPRSKSDHLRWLRAQAFK